MINAISMAQSPRFQTIQQSRNIQRKYESNLNSNVSFGKIPWTERICFGLMSILMGYVAGVIELMAIGPKGDALNHLSALMLGGSALSLSYLAATGTSSSYPIKRLLVLLRRR